MINLKDMIIRNLQEENAKLMSRHEVLKNKFNHLEQYGKGSNTEVPGIPNLIGDNELECLLIKIMKVIDIEFDDRDIEACHRISKSRENSKKTFFPFYQR